MPSKKTKTSSWNIFVSQYSKKHPNMEFGAMVQKAKDEYPKWKKSHKGGNMTGAGILSSINDFLWHHVAKPIGNWALNAIKTKNESRRF